jgi:hypothetical protein
MRYLVLVALVVGCSYPPPLDADPTPRPFQEEAEQYVREYMVHEMGMVEGILVYPVEVYWKTDCEGPNGEPGVEYNGVCMGGVMFGCDRIVAADWGCIGKSAFAHELGHCFRFVQDIGGDRYHWDNRFWEEVGKIAADLVLMEGCAP